MKNPSLSAQFRKTSIRIVTASAAAALLTYALAFYLFSHFVDKDIYPANYYEQQIPGIEDYIHAKNVSLLSQSGEEELKSIIRGDQMIYQVVDNDGKVLYGTDSRTSFKTKDELFGSMAGTTVLREGYYTRTVPITDDGGEVKGAVLLSYKIGVTFVNSRGKFIFVVIILSLLSPIVYIIGFTQLFSKVYAKKINQPLQMLIHASNKIKEKDLDFTIDYHSENELGRLCDAFSDMKEELKKSLSAQWVMEQERIEMSEALAHDLKSPLSLIMGYTDALIMNHSDSEKLHKYLTVIRKNAEKSAALVRQIQYTSCLEKSTELLHLTSFNLSDFLAQKLPDYELEASQKDIRFTLKIHDDITPQIQTDAGKLARILDNVVSNSLQYTPESGEINISVRIDKGQIVYKISDSGSGFNSMDLKKAFDKFYRGDKSRQTEGGHSGLGLYIVKQLAEQLGGSAIIENLPSQGACVIFWHPA